MYLEFFSHPKMTSYHGTLEKKFEFVVNQKSLKAIGGKSQNPAQFSGQFSGACGVFSFHIVFTHSILFHAGDPDFT